jgi:Coenzyme PQQ synthesis protein D (PqqD)
MTDAFPRARTSDLIVEEVVDEVLVYDLRSNEAHCLNTTAAAIWRACDGNTPIASLAEQINAVTGAPRDQDVVWHGLEQLHQHDLLEGTYAPPPGLISRRELIATLKTAALLLPLITSIIVPTAAMAGSCGPQGCQGPQAPQDVQEP